MSTENSNTSESNKFFYEFTDKLNLKNPNKYMALDNLSVYYTWQNIESVYKKINLKFLLPHGMKDSIYLMGHILFQTFKIILSTLLKNMKL